jgi:hypothetical protein
LLASLLTVRIASQLAGLPAAITPDPLQSSFEMTMAGCMDSRLSCLLAGKPAYCQDCKPVYLLAVQPDEQHAIPPYGNTASIQASHL